MIIILAISLLIFIAKRNLTYLHMLQQQEYYDLLFLRWLWQHKVIDKKLTIAILLLGSVSFLINSPIVIAIMAGMLLFSSYIEKNPILCAKKKLVITSRAKRIYALSLIISSLILLLIKSPVICTLLIIHSVPFALIAANLLLRPFEKRIQRKFWLEAKQKLTTLDPYIIAITGSFGKTSVKHFLGHILQTTSNALMTPGSINTDMGIARIIREQLGKQRYFIVEMGAYYPGSIARLCKLTPPKMGIITAIGKAHYDRFKSLDTVSRAKFELAESVVDNNGIILTTEQVATFDYPKNYIKNHPNNFIVANNTAGDLVIEKALQTTSGLAIDLLWQQTSYHLTVPIYGLHNAQNIALAFAAACKLDIPPVAVITALKSTPQVNHRLEVNRQRDCTIIDDAYNANPSGFCSGLQLMQVFHQPHSRRILITPGLIELGKHHDSEHEQLGKIAAKHVDIALIVNAQRIQSFITGFKEIATPKQTIIALPSFNAANKWLEKNSLKNDVILLANDLPDFYEAIPQL